MMLTAIDCQKAGTDPWFQSVLLIMLLTVLISLHPDIRCPS